MAATRKRVDCATAAGVDAGDDDTPTDAKQQSRLPLMPPPTYDEAVTSSEADHDSKKTAVKKYTSMCDREDATTVIAGDEVSH